jgi:hypothetical protein
VDERGLVLADMWKEQELRRMASPCGPVAPGALGMELTDLKIKRLFLTSSGRRMSHRGHGLPQLRSGERLL